MNKFCLNTPVELKVAADPGMMLVIRLTTAGVVTRAGLTIDAMDNLRDGIGLRAYGQRDPVQEYRLESYDMFNDMVHYIREDTVRRLYQARVERMPERRRTVNVENTQTNLEENTNGQAKKGGAPTNKTQPGAAGRNQPCPCGSGKKYKHCCGK